MVCLFIWTVPSAHGDEGEIQVVEAGAQNQFPNSIRFFVTALSTDEIEEVRVFFRTTGRVTAGAYQELDFEADKLVSASTILPTGGGVNYIPPGTEITYHFEIWDASGAVHRTPRQKIVYADSRFEWRTFSSGAVIVYHYGGLAEEQVLLIVETARKTTDRLAQVLGFDPSEPIRIVAYHSYSDMAPALPFRYQMLAGAIRIEGIAFGDERVVLIPGFGSSVEAITSHEITHLAVTEVTGRAHIRVPAWLDEGLAEFGNLDPTGDYEDALRLGILNDQIKPLWTLGAFGVNPEEILIAYGQGQSVVNHLISNYGVDKMAALMQAIRDSFDIDQALEAVYGFDQYGLDVEWRQSIGLEPLPGPERPSFRAVPSPTTTPTAVPTPTPTQVTTPVRPTETPTSVPAPTSSPVPTPTSSSSPAQSTATPEPTAVATVKQPNGGSSSPGCSSPHPDMPGAMRGDLAMIGIILGLLAMVGFRLRRLF